MGNFADSARSSESDPKKLSQDALCRARLPEEVTTTSHNNQRSLCFSAIPEGQKAVCLKAGSPSKLAQGSPLTLGSGTRQASRTALCNLAVAGGGLLVSHGSVCSEARHSNCMQQPVCAAGLRGVSREGPFNPENGWGNIIGTAGARLIACCGGHGGLPPMSAQTEPTRRDTGMDANSLALGDLKRDYADMKTYLATLQAIQAHCKAGEKAVEEAEGAQAVAPPTTSSPAPAQRAWSRRWSATARPRPRPGSRCSSLGGTSGSWPAAGPSCGAARTCGPGCGRSSGWATRCARWGALPRRWSATSLCASTRRTCTAAGASSTSTPTSQVSAAGRRQARLLLLLLLLWSPSVCWALTSPPEPVSELWFRVHGPAKTLELALRCAGGGAG